MTDKELENRYSNKPEKSTGELLASINDSLLTIKVVTLVWCVVTFIGIVIGIVYALNAVVPASIGR
jgi:hypothetical protein